MKSYNKIATYTYASEYAVLKLLLDQENIRYVFENETSIGVLPFHSNAIGGIFLKVHPEDIERAQQILNNFNNKSPLDIT